jgi:nucleoside-diphosphate-sugar epimerase
LNTSVKSWWDNVVSDKPKTKETLAFASSWVDVRDLADAHVLALEKEAAGGERIIVSAGAFVWQEWRTSLSLHPMDAPLIRWFGFTVDIANSIQPSPLPGHKLPVGDPSIEKKYTLTYDTEKEGKILGINHRTKEQVTRDHLEDFAKRGW